ncbi:urease accessory UreF family protein [Streptomyces sp. NPDC002790]|uniref:urease accessory protein UreF n=1 Tax=Streptomyces sp. NPDC002790 TaxID=3154431 RepID=UPI003326E824
MDTDRTAGPDSGCHPLGALLLLTDGRFPAGAHAHSGGLEAIVALEGVQDPAALELFLKGRAATVGRIAAAFAAAGCAAAAQDTLDGPAGDRLSALDAEFDARTPSSALRAASRTLGRQLLRSGRRVWPHPVLEALAAIAPRGTHQPIALGAVAAAAQLGPRAAAWSAAHDAVLGPATAAIRLLGLDPFSVYEVLARLGPLLETVATEGTTYRDALPEDLPAHGSPLLDLSAERHATWEVRLFAS